MRCRPGGDRLDALAFEPAEQTADEGVGVSPLLLTSEQGEVTLEETAEVVATALDVVGRDLGVGEEG